MMFCNKVLKIRKKEGKKADLQLWSELNFFLTQYTNSLYMQTKFVAVYSFINFLQVTKEPGTSKNCCSSFLQLFSFYVPVGTDRTTVNCKFKAISVAL